MDSEGKAFHSMVVDISDSSSDFPSLFPVLPGLAFLMLGRLATDGKDEVFTTVGLLGLRSSTSTSVWKKTPAVLAGAEAE